MSTHETKIVQQGLPFDGTVRISFPVVQSKRKLPRRAFRRSMNSNTLIDSGSEDLPGLALFRMDRDIAAFGSSDSRTCGQAANTLLDEGYPPHEQFPRRFALEFQQVEIDGRIGVILLYEGKQIGDLLTDNSREDDGYRFHDVFHFAYATVLCWSPMARSLLRCKRKSRSDVDEIEDGARSRILEEAICAMVFAYASERNYLAGVECIEPALLSSIRSMTRGREVFLRSVQDWENAIIQSYRIWRLMRLNHGGTFIGDLLNRTIEFRAPSENTRCHSLYN